MSKKNQKLTAMNQQASKKRRWLALGTVLVVLALAAAALVFFWPHHSSDQDSKRTPDQPVALKTDAKSALVVDLTTGQILGDKKADEQVAIASQSKMLTAYGVLKNIQSGHLNWDDWVKITNAADLSKQSNDAFSHLDIQSGDQVRVKDLYRAMFTNSANDAAFALVAHLTPAHKTGQDTLESWAKDLNLKGSAWYNGAGQVNGDAFGSKISSAPNDAYNHASATQIAQIANKILAMDPSLKQLRSQNQLTYVKNKKVTLTKASDFGTAFDDIESNLKNPNNLQILGLKSGSTPEAGGCFTGYVKSKDGHEFLTVVNDAGDYQDNVDRYQDTIDIVDQVLAKKEAHTYQAGSQLPGQTRLPIEKDRAKAQVQVGDTRTYWTAKQGHIELAKVAALKQRPNPNSDAVLTYAQPTSELDYLPGSSKQQREIPLVLNGVAVENE
ncbi:serine hydrolase [Leuconostocaceae bacterium ESL0958]|nr:serine hydrolase [Leuconostocaceae bacterium ESL0958]